MKKLRKKSAFSRITCALTLIFLGCHVLPKTALGASVDILDSRAQASSKTKGKEKVDYRKITEKQWQQRLTKEQFKVCRKNGTERAFSGKYVNMKEDGVYTCVACGQELFRSNTKFDSGTGWPSFWDVIQKENLEFHDDSRFFMKRIEVKCSRCGSHLGHVFDDGPDPTGKRYCINSVCLDFVKSDTEASKETSEERGLE